MPVRKTETIEQTDIIYKFGEDYLKDLNWLRNFEYGIVNKEDLMRLRAMYVKYLSEMEMRKISDVKELELKITKRNAPYYVALLSNVIRRKYESFTGTLIARMIEEEPGRLPETAKTERTKRPEDSWEG